MAEAVVFLGPSLERSEALRLSGEGVEFRPPVKRRDLPSLGEEVGIVAIIDGVFLGDAAVGHREIVEKLREGVKVIGGGSMGALRASELRTLGMEGVGRVFELYASGSIEGDDEVALVFDPETLIPLSEPLVNLRFNLERAVSAGAIDASERNAIICQLREMYYPRRGKEAMLSIAGKILKPSSLSKLDLLVREDYVDVKREDAIEVIRAVEIAHKKLHNRPKNGGLVNGLKSQFNDVKQICD